MDINAALASDEYCFNWSAMRNEINFAGATKLRSLAPSLTHARIDD